MVCEFYFNPKPIRVSLGVGRKTYLPGSVPSVFEFKPELKKKERKPPNPRNNQETSSEFGTKLKSHIYNFDNVSESGDEFRAATGLTVESFNNLLEFLNPGKDSCNIKFHDTSSRLSQSCDGIGSPKSGPKPKLSSQD